MILAWKTHRIPGRGIQAADLTQELEALGKGVSLGKSGLSLGNPGMSLNPRDLILARENNKIPGRGIQKTICAPPCTMHLQ